MAAPSFEIHAGTKLTASSLDRKLHGWPLPAADEPGGTSLEHGGLVIIDLTETRWADYAALAQILLLIESTARQRIAVSLRVPQEAQADWERRTISNRSLAAAVRGRFQNEVLGRRAFVRFLKNTGFLDAARVDHLPNASQLVTITAGLPPDLQDEPGNADSLVAIATPRLVPALSSTAILRFRWLTRVPDSKAEEWIDALARIMSLGQPQLSSRDALSITRGALWELVHNVWNHAQPIGGGKDGAPPPAALLGAIALGTRQKVVSKPTDYRTEHSEYAEWVASQPRRIFRFVVGDSGIGIPATLRVPDEELSKSPVIPPIGARTLTRSEQLIFHSIHPTSTRYSDRAQKPGPRGLALVDRLARAYSGIFGLRSRNAYSGWANADHRRLPGSRGDLPMIPGTLVELSLIAGSNEREPEDIDTARSAEDPGTIRWINLAKSEDATGLLAAVERELAEERDATLVFACSQETLNRLGRQAIAQQLAYVGQSVRPRCRLALLAPDVPREDLIPFLKAYEDALVVEPDIELLERLRVLNPPEPMLVMAQDGLPQWWGGASRVRKVLYTIGESATGTLEITPTSSAKGGAEVAGETPHLPPKWMVVDRTHVASFSINPTVLWRAASERAGILLGERAEVTANDSRASGPYPTPAALLSESWIDPATLIGNDRSLTALAAFGAAKRVQAIMSSGSHRVTSVTGDLRGIGRFAESLAGCLAARFDQFEARRATSAPLLRRGEENAVVVVAGVINSSYVLSSMIRGLMKEEKDVVAAVVLVDTWPRERKHLNVAGRSIPLVAMTRYPIRQVDPPQRPLDEMVAEIEASMAINELGTPEFPLSLAHVIRNSGRHLPAHVHSVPIADLTTREHSDLLEILAAEVASWQKANGVQTKSDARLEVWYPTRDIGLARQGAETLVASLRDNFDTARIRAVDLTIGANHFDGTLEPNTHIVVFDWEAVTARTLIRLLLRAADAGPKSVVAAVVLSQLGNLNRSFLQSIRDMNAALPLNVAQLTLGQEDPTPETEKPSAPLGFRESIAYRLPAWEMSEFCDYCRIIEVLRQVGTAAATPLLERVNKQKMEVLRIRTHEEFSAEEPRDLYGAHLDDDQGREVLIAYEALRAAGESQAKALLLGQLLRRINAQDESSWKMAMVRALLLEPSRIRRFPLDTKSFREQFAAACRALLLNGRLDGRDKRELWEAQVVLRMVSNDDFLELAPEIIDAHCGSTAIMEEILHGLFTSLLRRYNYTEQTIEAYQHALAKVGAAIRRCQPPRSFQREASLTLDYLSGEAAFRFQQHEGPPGLMSAWAELKRDYETEVVQHHGARAAAFRVLNALHGPTLRESIAGRAPVDDDFWPSIARDWSRCERFLAGQVLPRLSQIQPVIFGRYISHNVITADAARRLRPLILANGDRSELFGIGTRIKAAAEEAQLDGRLVAEIRDDVNWWYEQFFDPEPRSNLLGVIGLCPGRVEDAVGGMEAHPRVTAGEVLLEIESSVETSEVFCPTELMADALAQVIDNVYDHRAKGAGRPSAKITTTAVEEGIEVLVTNTNSDHSETSGSGRGLEGFSDRLSGFAAELDASPDLGGPADTFGVRITLRSWR